MQTITDARFLRTLARRFCRRSHLLDGGAITIVKQGNSVEIHISNGFCTVVCLGWRNGAAFVIERYTHPAFLSADLDGLERSLTLFVRRFLERHQLIDRKGTSTKGAA
jgi:hypothetical protein